MSIAEESGRLSIHVEYRGMPGELKKAERIMRRTMYRLRAAGVAVFGTVIVHRTGEIRNIVFNIEQKAENLTMMGRPDNKITTGTLYLHDDGFLYQVQEEEHITMEKETPVPSDSGQAAEQP